MDIEGRLTILNNVMAWNYDQSKRARALQTLEGHRDHEHYMKNARAILEQIMDLEEKQRGLRNRK